MGEQVGIFVSHHHSPEEDAFTRRLVADLQAAGANVWVDLENIAYDSFVKKINEGLVGREWLVLVMTPASLRSPWVNDEVNAALNQVRKGRMRGVIPIVAQPCEDSDIPILWDPLQRYDATSSYAMALAGLLRAIALPTISTHMPTPLAQSHLPASSAPTVQPAMQGTATDVRPSRIVDASGKGQYLTIKEAVNAAQPGDRIFIFPGTYHENIRIDKPLQLVGKSRQEVIIEGNPSVLGQDSCILVVAQGVTISQLSLQAFDGGLITSASNILWIVSGGELQVEDCDISSHRQIPTKGIEVTLGSLTMRRTTVRGCGDHGISATGSTAVVALEDCTIQGCKKTALYLKDGSAIVRNSRLIGNGEWGVHIDAGILGTGQGRGTFEHNQLTGNAKGAWNIPANSGDLVRRIDNQE